jgi:hypothetical protein
MRRVLYVSICAGLALVACGGGTGTTSSSSGGGGGTSSSTGPSAPSTSTGSGSGDFLTVSGSLSLSLHETANSANKCTANPNGGASGILIFDAYNLQFFLPAGSTTFPAPAGGNAGVAFYNGNDSSQEWAIGSSNTATAAGSATLSSDGKHGTVDVDMLPSPPSPNPSLKPIHVKGSFSCS